MSACEVNLKWKHVTHLCTFYKVCFHWLHPGFSCQSLQKASNAIEQMLSMEFGYTMHIPGNHALAREMYAFEGQGKCSFLSKKKKKKKGRKHEGCKH